MMKQNRDRIVAFCQDYLNVNGFEDYCVNGLQVEGSDPVHTIVTGVSLSEKLIRAAIDLQAQMIIVHHGIFTNQVGRLPAIKRILRHRLKLLLAHDLSLCGFHLPLDAHPTIGNNISLCRLLEINNPKPVDVGFVGDLARPAKFTQWVKLVERKLGTNCFAIAAGPKRVRRVGIISGGASPEFECALAHGADTYLCGDVREEIVRAVEEAGINFINAGHYNTERLGIQNLGKAVARRFKLKVKFVDIPCEV